MITGTQVTSAGLLAKPASYLNMAVTCHSRVLHLSFAFPLILTDMFQRRLSRIY